MTQPVCLTVYYTNPWQPSYTVAAARAHLVRLCEKQAHAPSHINALRLSGPRNIFMSNIPWRRGWLSHAYVMHNLPNLLIGCCRVADNERVEALVSILQNQ